LLQSFYIYEPKDFCAHASFQRLRPPKQQLKENGHSVAGNHGHFQVLHGMEETDNLGPHGDLAVAAAGAGHVDGTAVCRVQIVQAVFGQEAAAIQNEHGIDQEQSSLGQCVEIVIVFLEREGNGRATKNNECTRLDGAKRRMCELSFRCEEQNNRVLHTPQFAADFLWKRTLNRFHKENPIVCKCCR
jgi:hypothetical protein